MSKLAIYAIAITASLGASVAVSQAREIKAWDHTFTVDDAPAVVVPTQPHFNALVTPAQRNDFEERRAIDLDRAR